MVTDTALALCQVSVALWPATTVLGLTNSATEGGGTLTFTVTMLLAEPPGPVAVKV